jgi:hypothetical protein
MSQGMDRKKKRAAQAGDSRKAPSFAPQFSAAGHSRSSESPPHVSPLWSMRSRQ